MFRQPLVPSDALHLPLDRYMYDSLLQRHGPTPPTANACSWLPELPAKSSFRKLIAARMAWNWRAADAGPTRELETSVFHLVVSIHFSLSNALFILNHDRMHVKGSNVCKTPEHVRVIMCFHRIVKSKQSPLRRNHRAASQCLGGNCLGQVIHQLGQGISHHHIVHHWG